MLIGDCYSEVRIIHRSECNMISFPNFLHIDLEFSFFFFFVLFFHSRTWSDSKEKNSDEFKTFSSAQAFITSSSTQDSDRHQSPSKSHHHSDPASPCATGKAAVNYQHPACTHQRYQANCGVRCLLEGKKERKKAYSTHFILVCVKLFSACAIKSGNVLGCKDFAETANMVPVLAETEHYRS